MPEAVEPQGARERLVAAREEERRRLRRDLHDGLGPVLAGAALKLEAAENLLASRPGEAAELLDHARAEIQAAVGDVRRPRDLPAAIEVAAYRISVEAMTNAARHARAQTCTVRITDNGALELEISDDGQGLPDDYRAGVGIASMRERAEELGGTCEIERVDSRGTRVRASLPFAPT